MSKREMRLHDILLEKGLVTEQAVVRALEHQLVYGGRLGTNLVELGYVRLNDLGRMLALQWEVGHDVGLELGELEPSALHQVDLEVCVRSQAVPLRFDGNRLHIAMIEPSAENVVSLSTRLGHKIIPYIVPELRLLYWFEQYFQIRRPGRFLRLPETGPVVYQRRHYLRPTVDLTDPTAAFPGGEIMVFAPVEGIAGGGSGSREHSPLAHAYHISINARTGIPETDDDLEIDTSAFVELGSASPSGVSHARQQMSGAASSALIEQLLVGPLLPQAETRVLFWVRGEFAVACCAGGSVSHQARVPDLVLRHGQSPLMSRALREGDVVWGRREADAMQGLIADFLGVPPPGEHCIVPVLLAGRAIYLLCLQTRRGVRFPTSAMAELRRLSGEASRAYLRLRSGLSCWRR